VHVFVGLPLRKDRKAPSLKGPVSRKNLFGLGLAEAQESSARKNWQVERHLGDDDLSQSRISGTDYFLLNFSPGFQVIDLYVLLTARYLHDMPCYL